MQFLAGDFNMSLPDVPRQLRSRGIKVDCLAWYPWNHATECAHGSSLGLDSCAIFYLGGKCQVKRVWDIEDIPQLSAVAGPWSEAQGKRRQLDEYKAANTPGQHWTTYKSEKPKQGERKKEEKKT